MVLEPSPTDKLKSSGKKKANSRKIKQPGSDSAHSTGDRKKGIHPQFFSRKKTPTVINSATAAKLADSAKVKLEEHIHKVRDKDTGSKALRLYKSSTKKVTIEVYNAMWPFVTGVSLNADGEVVLY